MTNENFSFEQWHEALMDHARSKGGRANDAEAWRSEYYAGKTPEEAWADEWGD